MWQVKSERLSVHRLSKGHVISTACVLNIYLNRMYNDEKPQNMAVIIKIRKFLSQPIHTAHIVPIFTDFLNGIYSIIVLIKHYKF